MTTTPTPCPTLTALRLEADLSLALVRASGALEAAEHDLAAYVSREILEARVVRQRAEVTRIAAEHAAAKARLLPAAQVRPQVRVRILHTVKSDWFPGLPGSRIYSVRTHYMADSTIGARGLLFDRSTWNNRPNPETMLRPSAVVGFKDVHPNTPTASKPSTTWERLGIASRPADELMHRHYLAAMRQLAENVAFVEARAFYPDESGLLLACVLWVNGMEINGGLRPRAKMLWVGYNARSTYAAAIAAASNVPGHLLGGRS